MAPPRYRSRSPSQVPAPAPAVGNLSSRHRRKLPLCRNGSTTPPLPRPFPRPPPRYGAARLDSDPRASFTGVMPPARSDTRLLLGAGAAAVLGGVLVAVVLLLATSRADQPKTYRPFAAGPEDQLRKELRDGGPFYYPDAFGGK